MNPIITKEDCSEHTETSEEEEEAATMDIPEEFICPLTLEIMRDPVVSRYGHSYERDAILRWLAKGHAECPLSRRPMGLKDLVSNHRLKAQIRRWQLENQQEIAIVTDIPQEDDRFRIFGYIDLHDAAVREHDDPDVILEYNPSASEQEVRQQRSKPRNILRRWMQQRRHRRRQPVVVA
jgi:hypothetical protein